MVFPEKKTDKSRFCEDHAPIRAFTYPEPTNFILNGYATPTAHIESHRIYLTLSLHLWRGRRRAEKSVKTVRSSDKHGYGDGALNLESASYLVPFLQLNGQHPLATFALAVFQ